MKKIEHLHDHDHSSLRQRVFQELEEGILSGHYKAGQSLIEMKISEELGVSRTPVREAIRQLELEGLVHAVPNKGAVVLGISPKDIDDIYTIRMRIEGLAARLAAEKINAEEVEALNEAVDLMAFYIGRDDVEQVQEMDSRFHVLIYEACKSNPLRNTLSSFHHYIKRARIVSFEAEGRATKALEEHKGILDAIKSGNAELAEQLVCEHVKNAKENFLHEENRRTDSEEG